MGTSLSPLLKGMSAHYDSSSALGLYTFICILAVYSLFGEGMCVYAVIAQPDGSYLFRLGRQASSLPITTTARFKRA